MPVEFYKTDDLTRAAYFATQGHIVQKIEFETFHDCYFHFFISPDLKECIEEFESNDASVEPKNFAKWRDELRRKMFDKRDQKYGKR